MFYAKSILNISFFYSYYNFSVKNKVFSIFPEPEDDDAIIAGIAKTSL